MARLLQTFETWEGSSKSYPEDLLDGEDVAPGFRCGLADPIDQPPDVGSDLH